MATNTDRDRFAAMLGFKTISRRDGYAEVAAKVEEKFLNGVDIAHGGFLFTLCDYASALAANTECRIAISSSSTMEFIQKVPQGEDVLAVAEIDAATEKTGVYKVYITDAQTRKNRYCVFYTRFVFKSAK